MEAAEIILANADSEGIFRKSGAVSRQKEIKVIFVISHSGIQCWHHRLARETPFKWPLAGTPVRFKWYDLDPLINLSWIPLKKLS